MISLEPSIGKTGSSSNWRQIFTGAQFVSNLLPPPIICQFQEKLRNNLSKLIDCIRQGFIIRNKNQQTLLGHYNNKLHKESIVWRNNKYIEGKLTKIGRHIRKGRHTNNEGDCFISRQQYIDRADAQLIQRILLLEVTLKNIQQNEARLLPWSKNQKEKRITPLKQLSLKTNFKQNFLTLQQIFSGKEQNQYLSSSNFRLFALLNQPQNNILHVSKAGESIRSEYNLQTYLGQRQSSLAEPSKLKNPKRKTSRVRIWSIDRNYAQNHSHRLNFMVKSLNS